MREQSFSLIPLAGPNIPDITIKGRIIRHNSSLIVYYALAGKLEDIFLPSLSANPLRKEELWKTTCLELFLAVKDLPQYWEFNMSPSGDWNVYRMDAYRRIGFAEEMSLQPLQLEAERDASGFLLRAAIDLSPVFQAKQILEAGITAIVQAEDGSETYWALVHPGARADFHLRESFILALAG